MALTLNPVQLDLFADKSSLFVDSNLTGDMQNALYHLESQPSKHIRYAALQPATVYQLLNVDTLKKDEEWSYRDIQVTINRPRMQTFHANPKCVCCGVEGNVYVIDRHVNERQTVRTLNLYALVGKELVLMTVDHILPDSIAGKYHPTNFQTMCRKCNTAKQNLMSQADIATVRANPDNHIKAWAHRPYVELLLDMHEMIAMSPPSKTRSKMISTVTHAAKHLNSTKAAPKLMNTHLCNLQMNFDRLRGIEPKPVVAPVVVQRQLSVYERMCAWFVAQLKMLRSIRIVVTQPA